jgi:hypothetical protein
MYNPENMEMSNRSQTLGAYVQATACLSLLLPEAQWHQHLRKQEGGNSDEIEIRGPWSSMSKEQRAAQY